MIRCRLSRLHGLPRLPRGFRLPGLLPILALTGLVALGSASASTELAAQETRVVIVSGLGGEERFRESFAEWGIRLHDALVESGVPREHVRLLTEDPSVDPDRIHARSEREQVERALREAGVGAKEDDRLLLVLIGHGSGSGPDSRVSLPGPSLRAADYAELLDALPMRSIAVVNTASASGDFIGVLAGEGRVVITATRSAQQRTATIFGGYFVDAFVEAKADLDRDGRVSLMEAYEYARQETERSFSDRGLLPSEHPRIAVGPGGQGVERPMEEEAFPTLAARFVVGGSTPPVRVDDPEASEALRALYRERDRVEEQVDELAARRTQMGDEAYQAALEPLLLELARIGQEIRRLEGGELR